MLPATKTSVTSTSALPVQRPRPSPNILDPRGRSGSQNLARPSLRAAIHAEIHALVLDGCYTPGRRIGHDRPALPVSDSTRTPTGTMRRRSWGSINTSPHKERYETLAE
jgi:hypothetical protein